MTVASASAKRNAAASGRRYRLRSVGGALALLVLLLGAGSAWLLGTTSGLRYALARAQSFTHGALTVTQAQGRLIGPLTLTGLRYRDGSGLDARVATLHLNLRVLALLHKQLHLLQLDVDGVNVMLAPSAAAQKSESHFSLKPPIDLVLDQVHVGALTISRASQPVFASSKLDLSGSWTGSGIELRTLNLQAPDGHVTLDGKLAIGTYDKGNGSASFVWKVGSTNYAGSFNAHTDGRRAKIDLTLQQPMLAQLQLDLQQGDDYKWTAKLDAPGLDPGPWLGDSSLKLLAISLQGQGDRYSASVNGLLKLNDYQVSLQPLRVQFSRDFSILTLQELNVGSPQVSGRVAASGTVQLDAQPVSADLLIQWKDLQLPANLVGQPLASRGILKASGSVNRYHAEGDVALGPPGKLASLALNLDGTPQQINLHTLALKQARGNMQVNGTLTLQPALAWQVQATANQLDPGQLLAGWNGALDFDIASHGTLPQNRPDVTLDIRKLIGTLRQRAVSGNGKLHLSPSDVLDGQLNLASGGSTVGVTAKSAGSGDSASNDIALNLAVTSLGDWLPDSAGRLNGAFHVRGRQPRLALAGQLQGQALVYQQQQLASLHLDATMPDISNPSGKLTLALQGVNAGGLQFSQVSLHASGSAAQHTVNLDAHGSQVSAALAINGAQKGTDWHGTLAALTLAPQGMPTWQLQQPAQLTYVGGGISLSETCLNAGNPQLCVQAKQDKAGNLDGSYRLRQLPLALLMNAAGQASMPVRADGTLEGDGSIQRSAAGALTGSASITSAHGTITSADHPDAPLLSYNQLGLTATLSPAGQQFELRSAIDGGGRLDGQITISGAQQSLAGQLDLHLNKLDFIELLTDQVANVKGALNGSFRVGGTLAQPAVLGSATLSEFSAELPVAGLKLAQGRLQVSTLDATNFHIEASVTSGKGALALDGSVGLGTTGQTVLTLKGSQFTTVDIPAAKVVSSPDLTLTQDAKGIHVGGALTLESAEINLEKLPGAGATKASPDVVIIDEKPPEQAPSALPLSAQILVDLGNQTHLVGKGLDGHLRGQLTVSETPGRATSARGQITVDGSYKAYGQNLQIERGQLLFASTPIDNPGLNIRAVRKINPNATVDDGQVVGLLIAGTAQQPSITVFSKPIMEQSDALSYLITGKPLSDVKGGEGNAVSSAAQALGSAGGNLLAKRIGTRLGVDDIGVSSSDALNGNSAFTVGKYLSPRLYLSYGVGLFEPGQVITLRYRLTQRWSFEAQNATDFNRASLNYRYER